MNDKTLRKLAKLVVEIAQRKHEEEVMKEICESDIPIEEIYERHFDAPQQEKADIIAQMTRMRKEDLFRQNMTE